MTLEEWRDTLTYEKATKMRFIGMVLNETIRICAPLKFTSDFCFTEDIVLNGATIKKGMDFFIMVQHIHSK